MVDISSNLLRAIDNLSECRNFDLKATQGVVSNMVSAQGKPLEGFVKASFCGRPDTGMSTDMAIQKHLARNQLSADDVFCYQGSVNNPPDAMLRDYGDAIEIKKVEGIGTIHLNSSLPKQRLYADDKQLKDLAVKCEPDWESRDMLYVIGNTDASVLNRYLFFFYGDCVFKNNKFYHDVFMSAKNSLKGVDRIDQTGNEYGTIKDVDELGIDTNMRLRPQNSFAHPFKIFSQLESLATIDHAEFSLFAVMRTEKFSSFTHDEQELLTDNPKITHRTEQIRDPDNPEGKIDVEVFSFSV